MKNITLSKILVISLIILILAGAIFLITNQKERYFKKIVFNNDNIIENATQKKYLDTIVYSGLKILDIKNITVIILPIGNAPILDLNPEIELKAHIVYYLDKYYIFIDDINREQALKVLSHELIHLNQYYKGYLRVNNGVIEWHKKSYDGNNILYEDRLWEIDAFDKQDSLLNKIELQLFGTKK